MMSRPNLIKYKRCCLGRKKMIPDGSSEKQKKIKTNGKGKM